METTQQRKTVLALRILYPVWVIVGMFGILYVPSKLVIPGDAATTAQNILDREFLYRAGILSSLLTQLVFIVVVLYLYKLFEKVHKEQSVLMVVLALVSVPMAMLNSIFNVAALMKLDDPEQLMFFIDLNAKGVDLVTIFWGLWLFPLGFLIYRSGYFPKLIGIAAFIGGAGYTLGFLMKVLLPEPGFLDTVSEIMTFGEIIWVLWLIIMGARLPVEQAKAA